jgi:hypothetical protein
LAIISTTKKRSDAVVFDVVVRGSSSFVAIAQTVSLDRPGAGGWGCIAQHNVVHDRRRRRGHSARVRPRRHCGSWTWLLVLGRTPSTLGEAGDAV